MQTDNLPKRIGQILGILVQICGATAIGCVAIGVTALAIRFLINSILP